MSPFTPRDWKDSPNTTTPIDQAALEDLEERVTDYADSVAGAAVTGYATTAYVDGEITGLTPITGTLGTVNHGGTAGTARPTGFSAILWIGSVTPTNATDGDIFVDTSA